MGTVEVIEDVVAPTPSATVLLLRDGAATATDGDGQGPEVLMLERSLRSDFVGGAFVFPGGKVDDLDGALPAARRRGPDPEADAVELGVDAAEAAVAVRVAAVRETFEEAGVLLASRADGAPVTAADLASASFRAARAALIDRGPVADWHTWLAGEDLVLDLDRLAFWSWWVTPEGVHRRYDTRFFVAVLPAAQRDVAAHDEVEVTSNRWVTPAAALAAQAAGEATIIFPTRCNLRDLAEHASAADAFVAAAAGAGDRGRTMPTARMVDGVAMVQHPDGRPPEPA